ncbi:MAG: hypothetical protein WCI88_12010 [Chloroflexota bacterium]
MRVSSSVVRKMCVIIIIFSGLWVIFVSGRSQAQESMITGTPSWSQTSSGVPAESTSVPIPMTQETNRLLTVTPTVTSASENIMVSTAPETIPPDIIPFISESPSVPFTVTVTPSVTVPAVENAAPDIANPLIPDMPALRSGPQLTQSFSCASVNSISAIECNALVALYTYTRGAAWYRKSGWLTNSDPCTWAGVFCNYSGNYVYQIALSGNNLMGTIPPQIGNLTRLQYLGLSHNQIGGEIPVTIVNLVNIPSALAFDHWLGLGYNQLRSTNLSVRTFLSRKDPDWEKTQLPSATNLIFPINTASNNKPTYVWSEISNATQYILDVDNGKYQYRYTSSQARCGTGRCFMVSPISLSIGIHTWKVRTYNQVGYGTWSASRVFAVFTITPTRTGTIPPPKTSTSTPRTPTNTPTLTQTVVPNPLYSPMFIGSCSSGASSIRVDSTHNRAYLVSRNQISIFNLPPGGLAPTPIATPTISSLSLISDLDYSSNADEVYLASYGTGFVKVKDLSTSPVVTTPSPAWAPVTQGYGQSIALNNTMLLVGTSTSTRIFDPLTMTEFKAYVTGAVTRMMVEKGGTGYVYISTETNGIWIANCSGLSCTFPVRITVPGSAASGSYAQVSSSDGNKYLYVAAYSYGLRIYDVTIPTSPVTKGSFVCTGCIAKSVVVSGNYAYVALGTEGLAVIDISNPLYPKAAYAYAGINVVDLDIDDNTVYLALDNTNDTNCFMGFDLLP